MLSPGKIFLSLILHFGMNIEIRNHNSTRSDEVSQRYL